MTGVLRLICCYYVLVFFIGGGQIAWAVIFGCEYAGPSLNGFYMAVRLLCVGAILLLWLFRRTTSLLWFLAAENIINVFMMSYYLYECIWLIAASHSLRELAQRVELAGLYLGWNGLLWLISLCILVYLLRYWDKAFLPRNAKRPVEDKSEQWAAPDR